MTDSQILRDRCAERIAAIDKLGFRELVGKMPRKRLCQPMPTHYWEGLLRRLVDIHHGIVFGSITKPAPRQTSAITQSYINANTIGHSALYRVVTDCGYSPDFSSMCLGPMVDIKAWLSDKVSEKIAALTDAHILLGQTCVKINTQTVPVNITRRTKGESQ